MGLVHSGPSVHLATREMGFWLSGLSLDGHEARKRCLVSDKAEPAIKTFILGILNETISQEKGLN